MKIDIIPDKEIILTEENDLLGTKPYTQTLIEIIQKSKGKATLGVFGGWGAGKTSIIKTVQSEFEKYPEKYSVLYYDSWKHKKNAFKNKLLLELTMKLGLSVDEIRRELNSNQESIHYLESKNLNWIINAPFYGIWFFLLLYFIKDNLFDIRAVIAAIGVAITINHYLLKEIFKKDEIKIQKKRVSSSERYEELFKEILGKGINFEKHIIIIDNIDRCEPKIAKKLLSDIKNFLENEKILFIIAVADDALKKHLKLNDSDFNEFQRKIFDSIIKIRPFSSIELYKFAEILNKKYSLKFPSEVINICTSFFSRNPRRIIHFLNALQTELFLITKQEQDKMISKDDSLSKNVEGLARLIFIKEEWTELFDKIKTNNKFLIDLDAHIKHKGEFNQDYSFPEQNGININSEKFDFIKKTRLISKQGYPYYFMNKEVFLEGKQALKNYILDSNFTPIFKQIKLERLDTKNLMKIIGNVIEEEILIKENSISSLMVFEFTLQLIYFKRDELKTLNTFFDSKNIEFLSFLLNDKKLYPLITNVNPNDFVRTMIALSSLVKENKNIATFFQKIFIVFLTNDISLSHGNIDESLQLVKNEMLFNFDKFKNQNFFISEYFNQIDIETPFDKLNLYRKPYTYFNFFGGLQLFKLKHDNDSGFEDFIKSIDKIEEKNDLFTIIRYSKYAFISNDFNKDWFGFFLGLVKKIKKLEYHKKNSKDFHDNEHEPILEMIEGIVEFYSKKPNDELNDEFSQILNDLKELSFCNQITNRAKGILELFGSDKLV